MEKVETYRCSGHCRRTGFTAAQMMLYPSQERCPYCSGQLVSESTGKPKQSPWGALPSLDEFKRNTILHDVTTWEDPE